MKRITQLLISILFLFFLQACTDGDSVSTTSSTDADGNTTTTASGTNFNGNWSGSMTFSSGAAYTLNLSVSGESGVVTISGSCFSGGGTSALSTSGDSISFTFTDNTRNQVFNFSGLTDGSGNNITGNFSVAADPCGLGSRSGSWRASR